MGILLLYVPIFLLGFSEAALDDFISNWLCFPSELIKIPFRIWTIFTYMFLHGGFLHLFFNMLTLYIFGRLINDWVHNKHIVPIYIWGGVVGALVFAIGFNVFPVFEPFRGIPILGASAGVMAIVLATATLNPTATIRLLFIPWDIQIRYIALFFVFTDFAISLRGSNAGGALAHLGGAFMGWMYIVQLRKGNDLSEPVHRVANLLAFRKGKDYYTNKKTKNKKTTVKKQAKPKKPSFKATMNIYKGSQRSDYYGNEYGHLFIQKYKDMSREECLNAILEKIKRSGYDSLSEDEKVFLNRYN